MSKAVNYDDIDLMRYADREMGEDGDEAAAIASFIDADPDAGRKIEALDQMSEVVRSRLELAADEAEPRLDAMWATIERRIQANGARESVAAAPARSQEHSSTAEPVGLWAAIGRFFEQYRGHFLTGAVAAGAAAALILALRPPEQVVIERPVAVIQKGPANSGNGAAGVQNPMNDSGAAQVKLVNDDPSPPEIEQLEVTGGSGTVFVMPREGEDDVAATVIFLETDDVEGPL